MDITLDFETRSHADLKKVGAWAYSEDPSTEVICAAWGIGDRPIKTWTPLRSGGNLDSLYDEIEDGAPLEAHNVAFEYAIWMNIMVPQFGAPVPKPEQWRDTMAACSYYAMPQSLDRVARVLGFEPKDPAGTRLISKYSKLHLKTAKTEIPDDDLDKFIEYCVQDVRIEQSISDYLGDLPEREQPIFQLDQRMNRRGLNLDLPGIAIASAIVDQRSEELTKKFRELTGLGPNQTVKVKEWLNERGAKLDDLQKETIKKWLHDAPQGEVRDVVELRQKIAKASTKKLDAMARQVSRDGRARYQTRYHGAVTGRPTGTGFQPLNLTKGYDDVTPETLVRCIRLRSPKFLDLVYGDAMQAVANASRHWIKAARGSTILAGDFVSIEAVVLACLAGEQWKIEAFRNRDPLYAIMGCKIHGLNPQVAIDLGDVVFKAEYPKERADGKTGELAFGYQGALGAWLKFDNSGKHSDEQIIENCKAWRASHLAIKAMWYGMEDAAIDAVLHPGRVTNYREIGFEIVDEWLTMILPNEKRLWYFKPEIRMGWPQWHKPKEDDDCAAGVCSCKKIPKLCYRAQKAGQWQLVYTYGGKLTENACQAVSREILMPAMLTLDAEWGPPLRERGYITAEESPIILSIYDEIVTEIPEGFATIKEFEEIILERQPWFKDWPIRVDSWEGERYRK